MNTPIDSGLRDVPSVALPARDAARGAPPWAPSAARLHLRSVRLALLLIALAAGGAHSQSSDGAGQIVGRVLDARTGEPIPFAKISIEGTSFGTISRDDGRFTLPNVPVGAYRITASFMGYLPLTVEVEVQDGRSTETEIRLYDAESGITRPQPAPERARPTLDVATGGTVRTTRPAERDGLILDPTLENLVERQPGWIRDRHRLHLRGGRANEMLYLVDGVPMRDLVSGESRGGDAVSARSVSDVRILSGGFDAKYGQAAGIVDARIQEGAERHRGFLGYTTDALTGDRDLDQVELQLGGPLPLVSNALRSIGGNGSGAPRFFLDVATDLENGHLPSIANIPGGELLPAHPERFLGSSLDDRNFFYPRAHDDWRLLFKSNWRASASDEISLLWLKHRAAHQGFEEIDIADIDRNVGPYPWEWSRRFDHYYTVTEDQSSLALAWDHAWKPRLSWQIRLTRSFQSRHQDVGGKRPEEYDLTTDRSLSPERDTPFFRDAGEPTAFRDRTTATWALDWDWTHSYRGHDIRWGWNLQYEDVRYLNRDVADARTPQEEALDSFHVHPNTGALYVQDRVEIEGLIAHLGVRWDYWLPGRQAERRMTEDGPTLFGRRLKGTWSPRIQLLHPLGTRSSVWMNYGRFTQRPAYYYVYSHMNGPAHGEASRIGNPDLVPSVSVQTELGMNHGLTHDKSIELALYNRDTYELPALSPVTTGDPGRFFYDNRAHSRSRGVELTLHKQRTDRVSWAASYAYARAEGTSSDPNDLLVIGESGGDARGGSLEEGFLWWNRPHSFSGSFSYQIPRGGRSRLFGISLPSDLELNAYFLIRSGRAYTPRDAVGTILGPAYSENGPFDSTLDVGLIKGFQVGSRRFEVALQAFNLLDHRNAIELDPATGKRWKPGEGSLGVDPLDDPASLRLSDIDLAEAAGVELGVDPDDPRLGGLPPGSEEYEGVYAELVAEAAARVAPELRRRIEATIHRYADPSMIAPPRHVRISIGMEW